MRGTFEVFVDQAGGYRFRLRAANGQIILASQAYRRKVNALAGTRAVQRCAASEQHFACTHGAGGFMFNLKSRNEPPLHCHAFAPSVRGSTRPPTTLSLAT